MPSTKSATKSATKSRKRGKKSTSFRVGRVRAYLRGRVWYLCYHENGQRRQPRVGPDKEAARQMAAEINAQLEVGIPSALGFEPISIPEVRKRWLENHEHIRRSSIHTIRRYSAVASMATFRRWLALINRPWSENWLVETPSSRSVRAKNQHAGKGKRLPSQSGVTSAHCGRLDLHRVHASDRGNRLRGDHRPEDPPPYISHHASRCECRPADSQRIDGARTNIREQYTWPTSEPRYNGNLYPYSPGNKTCPT